MDKPELDLEEEPQLYSWFYTKWIDRAREARNERG